jgi:hypothetical protein
MLAIFVATVSISFASSARTVLLDATIEGARFAALADQDISAGGARTRQLVGQSLGGAFIFDVRGSTSQIGSLRSVRLVSTAAFSFVPNSKLLSVSSVATREVEY